MKIHLVFMCGPDSLEDLKEMMAGVREHFTGLSCVYHGKETDPEGQYLESIKGDGRVVYLPYSRRHSLSRNVGLHCSTLEDGDLCMQFDALERVEPKFAGQIRALGRQMRESGVNAIWYFDKPFVFEYHESLEYVGSPHETLKRDDGRMRAVEAKTSWPIEREVRYNVRPEKRKDQPFHWVGHYAKYFLFPWGSNHALLGLSDRGDPNVLFPIREQKRLEFLAEMRRRGYPRTLEGLNAMFAQPLDDKLRSMINEEKVWQDYYRLHILNDQTVTDEHKWTSLKPV